MRNFQDTFETLKRSFISAFSICMTVHLSHVDGSVNSIPKSNLLNYIDSRFAAVRSSSINEL